MIKPRYRRFLEELPKNGNKLEPSAIKAGFSKTYARARSNRVLKSALKDVEKHVAQQVAQGELTTRQAKKTMSAIVGLSEDAMMKRLRWMALENDKDAGTALKVLAPLVKEYGVILQADDEQKTVNAPILNLSFGTPSIAQNMAKNIDPVIEHGKQQSQELDNGFVEP